MAELKAAGALGIKTALSPVYRTAMAVPGSDLASAGRADRVLMRELPFSGCIDLRLDPGNAAALEAAANVLGVALPLASNTWVAAPAAHILWQAYDESLLVTPDRGHMALAAALRGALSGAHHAITDVSDLRAAFELAGPRARDVLQKGCAVDLHPRAFGAGACVQTALARTRVTLRQMEEAPTYQILVERSYARYLWDWLVDAAVEYG